MWEIASDFSVEERLIYGCIMRKEIRYFKNLGSLVHL